MGRFSSMTCIGLAGLVTLLASGPTPVAAQPPAGYYASADAGGADLGCADFPTCP